MDLLLDTHVCLWWAHEPERLRPAARSAIEDGGNTVWLSAASAWELSIKVHRGKLELDVDRMISQLVRTGCGLLGIGIDDAITAGRLEWSHRDPFDRMLAAQTSRTSRLLVTRDRELRAFLGAEALEA
jgi:PIN domain nuclease of toxin-antitoxin system